MEANRIGHSDRGERGGSPAANHLILRSHKEKVTAERDAGMPLWLAITGGNSNNGSNDGVSTLNLNNALSNANWNIGARPSST